MASNKTKTDRLHDVLPKHLNSKNNTNWAGLIAAIGEADQNTADLITEVRKQFFVKTANRPYLDRLAANNKIARPKLVGMSDTSFREYIPVLSYKPKQVKLIIDALLDVFFFKESTTAFIMSDAHQPFVMADGWELFYLVDGQYQEKIIFRSDEFTSISNAGADEIVASLNRQAKYSYATNYYDSITKKNFIRIFTKTVGSKGSIEIEGGRANIALRFNGFLFNAGNGEDTQWSVSKIGDLTTFQYVAGTYPGINQLQEKDIFICDIPGNAGSFYIKNIDIANNSITFNNLFSTVGNFTQTSAYQAKFLRPEKYVAYKIPRRAITWETSPGEIVVESPATPPVVQRSLKGSLHINGSFSLMTDRISNTSLKVADATLFPKSGSFYIEPVQNITTKIVTADSSSISSKNINGRLLSKLQKYTYSSRVVLSTTGNTTANSNQIEVASTTGLENGMSIFIDGLREDAVITNISGLVVTSSINLSNTATGAIIEFGGNTLEGISPTLPPASDLNELSIASLDRTSNVVTVTTMSTHNYKVGETVFIENSSGIVNLNTTGNLINNSTIITNIANMTGVSPGQLITGTGIQPGTKVLNIIGSNAISINKSATLTGTAVSINFGDGTNGSFEIKETTLNAFKFNLMGMNGSASSPGICRVERIGFSNFGSKIIICNAQEAKNTRIKGPYAWDTRAPYLLSHKTAKINTVIKSGSIVRLLDISNNEIPAESGFLIFDYGKENQEGPVRYLYKPTDNIIALDPSYIFTKNHAVGGAIVALNRKGAHVLKGDAAEYSPYLTDPAEAREILKTLIKSVKSAGIFINFLIRYPEQLYGMFDVYNQQEKGAGMPFD